MVCTVQEALRRIPDHLLDERAFRIQRAIQVPPFLHLISWLNDLRVSHPHSFFADPDSVLGTPTKRPASKGPGTKGPATKGPGYERSGDERSGVLKGRLLACTLVFCPIISRYTPMLTPRSGSCVLIECGSRSASLRRSA
jgi:hypothetical protein